MPDDVNARSAARRIGVRELRGRMSEVLREVREGATFDVTWRDQVVAELRPPASAERPRRKLGGMEGEIWMAPDFDTLPHDVLDAMEGSIE